MLPIDGSFHWTCTPIHHMRGAICRALKLTLSQFISEAEHSGNTSICFRSCTCEVQAILWTPMSSVTVGKVNLFHVLCGNIVHFHTSCKRFFLQSLQLYSSLMMDMARVPFLHVYNIHTYCVYTVHKFSERYLHIMLRHITRLCLHTLHVYVPPAVYTLKM